jgi:predicted phosphodiesterase
MLRKRKNSKSSKFFRRISRAFVSVIVLSALVLGVSVFVKEVYLTDTGRLARLLRPLLSKVNISVTEEQLGDVAGEFVSRISQTNLASGVTSSREDVPVADTPGSKIVAPVTLQTKIGFVADIHSDLAGLQTALYELSQEDIDALVVLGDLTAVGDIDSLQAVKEVLDTSSVTYYVLPGDHDLVQSVGSSNYTQIFGNPNQVIDVAGKTVLLMDNSANFTEISGSTMSWFSAKLSGAQFVILSQPLYTDGLSAPFNSLYMGSTRSPIEDAALLERQSRVLSQRNALLSTLRKGSALAVFSADHHKSSKIADPIRGTLSHHVVGAVADNAEEFHLKLLSASYPPRFGILEVYSDGSYKLIETLLE